MRGPRRQSALTPPRAWGGAALGASLALVAACYASHERGGTGAGDGGAGAGDGGVGDGSAIRDAASADGGSCEDFPGGAECGCVGGYRRCDTCDVPCPEGQLCWPRFGVCRPPDALTPEGAPIHDTCTLSMPGTAPWRRYCPGGGPCALSAEAARTRDGVGPCMSEAFCFEAPAADPPLPTEVVCVGSSWLEWSSPPPAGGCPDPRLCGGACGACPREGLGAESCVGIDATRPFGICARVSDACADRPIRVRDTDPFPPGLSCLLFEPRAEESFGWLVEPDDCRAYAGRYDGVRCRPGTVAADR